jgi:hypothetical protein
VHPGDGQWHRLSVTFVPNFDIDGATQFIVMGIKGNTHATVAYVDAFQLELKPHSTSYCDGDQGPGYSWSDTPHRSTSTRMATSINLDDYVSLINRNDTLSFRIVAQMSYGATATWPNVDTAIFDATGGGGDRILVRYNTVVQKFIIHINGTDRSGTSALSFSAGDWLDICATLDFDSGQYGIYMDGVIADASTTSLSAPTLTGWMLGSYTDYTHTGGFVFSEFAVFDHVLTAAEVAALYRMDVAASK